MTVPVVELTDVSIGYGDAPVVRHVDLRVEPGELVVLLGENGSGKSTLVKGILGIAPTMTGDARLFGQPASPAERRRIGYVPQRTTVAGGVPTTVREVVGSGRVARRRWFAPESVADRAAVKAALDAVRLTDRVRDPLATLSGGQQRRAHIARALAAEPELLVMDEPMAGVDAANVHLLAEAIARWKQEGLTLLVVAHGTGPLRPLVDRAVVMHRGHVRYDGPLVGQVATEHDEHIVDDHDGAAPRRLAFPEEPRWG
jgi:zinc transport system ATP-binding protein